MNQNPFTTAHLRVRKQSFSNQCLEGDVSAGDFEWKFIWIFGSGELCVEPPLGRALIQDALMRFLIKADYSLESGNDYMFTIRAKF